MGDKSNIGWTEATWNPVTGCSRVSDGCDHCYAETLSLRRGWTTQPWTPENAEENVVLRPDRLDLPRRWREPRMIFVNSMSDLFHPRVSGEYINEIWMAMYNNPRHTYQILTKRPKRLRDWTRAAARAKGWPEDEIWPDWIWLGTSIESREYVDRADLLREASAAVRFISAEPLLGPLVPTRSSRSFSDHDLALWPDGLKAEQGLDLTGIDWLIVGGESGSGYRPMEMTWVRDLYEASRATGVAFFAKQDAGQRPGQRGQIPDDLWVHEYPERKTLTKGALF